MKRIRRLLLLVTLALNVSCHGNLHAVNAPYSQENPLELKLLIHSTRGKDHAAFIEEEVRVANHVLMRAGIRVVEIRYREDIHINRVTYNGNHETKDNIDSIQAYRAHDPGYVHVFLVDSIDDLSEDDHVVGLYHSKASRSCTRIIVLTRDAKDNTLAHELGHFFGLNHVKQNDNIMHAPMNERAEEASFTARQLRKIGRNARQYDRVCMRERL